MTKRQSTSRAVLGAVTAAVVALGALAISPAAATAATASPSISVSASASVASGVPKPGTAVVFTLKVRNTGTVAETGVSVSRTAFTGTGTLPNLVCTSPRLTPGATKSCAIAYRVTQADIDAGLVRLTVRAVGHHGNQTATATASATGTLQRSPGASVTLKGSPASVTAAGQKVTWTLTVKNTGNVTLSRAAGDTITAANGTGPQAKLTGTSTGTLAPGASATYTATYTVTAADLSAASLTRTDSIALKTAKGVSLPVKSAPASVSVRASGSLTISASASPTSVTANTLITYLTPVTNTGDVQVNGLKVAPHAFSGTGKLGNLTCETTTLAPGGSTICSGYYSPTRTDLNRGADITSGFIATGTTSGGVSVTSDEATVTVTVVSNTPPLTVTSSAPNLGHPRPGSIEPFTFTVRNNGTVALNDPAIVLDSFSGTGARVAADCSGTQILPSQSVSCVMRYRLTQADIDAGGITYTVHATATKNGTPVSSSPDSGQVLLNQTAQLAITGTGPGTLVGVGAVGTLTYSVTNTGNTTVADLGIGTSRLGITGALSAPVCNAQTLAPGDTTTCTQTYTVAASDFATSTMPLLGVLAWAVGQNPVTGQVPYSTSVTVGFYALEE